MYQVSLKKKVFTSFDQYFVEASLAAITASSLFECNATSLAPIFGQFLPFLFAQPLRLCQVGWRVSMHSQLHISP